MSIYHYSLCPISTKDLLRRERFLKRAQVQLEKRLADAPTGRLSTSRDPHSSFTSFYLVSEDKLRSYLSTSQKETIRGLAQKEYDLKSLRLAKKELQMIHRIQEYFEMPKLEDAFDQCNPAKQAYIEPVLPSDEQFRKNWLAQRYIRKEPVGDDHPFPTEKGDRVCSKTEGMEADYMFHHGYDYLYEKRLELIDRGRRTWRYPDFTLLDPVTREEVIFEHFGMVDNEGYQQSMFNKIRLYEENGYIIGENFLFTFETAEHPFTMDQFIRILEARFPRQT